MICQVLRVTCDGDGCNEELEFCGPPDDEAIRKEITNWYGWTWEHDAEQNYTQDFCKDCSRMKESSHAD